MMSNKMNTIKFVIVVSIVLLGADLFYHEAVKAYGQELNTTQEALNALDNATDINANSTIAKVINEKYNKSYTYNPRTETLYEEPQLLIHVHLNYESPSTILISGELINSRINTFNYQLWEAMDLLKNQYGFKLQNVMTSGVGSVGNPTTVYILMTK